MLLLLLTTPTLLNNTEVSKCQLPAFIIFSLLNNPTLQSSTPSSSFFSYLPPLKQQQQQPPSMAQPLAVVAKRWGAGFTGTGTGAAAATAGDSSSSATEEEQGGHGGTLGLLEDCVGLEPWRLVIAGDFIRAPSLVDSQEEVEEENAATTGNATAAGDRETSNNKPSAVMMPLERSSLSGLEAGERAASFFLTP